MQAAEEILRRCSGAKFFGSVDLKSNFLCFLGNETTFSFLLQGFDPLPTVPLFLLRLILIHSPFHLSVQQSEHRESPLSSV